MKPKMEEKKEMNISTEGTENGPFTDSPKTPVIDSVNTVFDSIANIKDDIIVVATIIQSIYSTAVSVYEAVAKLRSSDESPKDDAKEE